MSDWAQGYVTDIGYTYGYYGELNPNRARLALLNAGYDVPEFKTACELGFGQGVSVNINAAASGLSWWGTDFNPSQAAFARQLASASGAALTLTDDAFEAYAARDDLPEFDFIALHGIWSWVNDGARSAIVDLISRRLKVGGVLYISYNTSPGWANFVPMRELLLNHAETLSPPSAPMTDRLDNALKFAGRLMEAKPAFARNNPAVAERLTKINEQNRAYLVHEYMNRDWVPMSIARLRDWLAPAKLSYAGSAWFSDAIDVVNLTEAQQSLLGEIPDPILREEVRDLIVAQQFRRDYWIKGPTRLAPLDQMSALRAERVMLIQPPDKIELKIVGALGEATLHETIYRPVIDALADYRPRTIGELADTLASAEITFPLLLQSLFLLIAKGAVAPVHGEEAAKAARPAAGRLNERLTKHARTRGDIPYLASPVVGGGVGIGRFEQLFLTAYREGIKEPGALAEHVWSVLKPQGQAIVHEGKTYTDEHDNLALLHRHSKAFLEEFLPLFRGLGLV